MNFIAIYVVNRSEVFERIHSIHDVLQKNLNPQDFWEFGACAECVYKVPLPLYKKREPGIKAKSIHTWSCEGSRLKLVMDEKTGT